MIDGSILDLSDALTEWERPQLIKTVTNTTVDFEPVENVTGRTQDCVVQVAIRENVNNDTLDWSLEHLLIHSKSALEIDELIEYDGRDYIVVEKGPWRGYGYFEVIATETKRPVKAVTP